MSGLRVLITNNTLGNRAGSELYVRDLATGLLERGHTPIAYSSDLGAVATELRRATVPVVQDLDALGTPPDLIHGHHHVETMTALLRFPETPAVFFCHGWIPWEEMPLRHPRILRYVAVDHTCRDRLICESGVPEGRVRLLLNFVDLRRFRPRAPLPPRPQRALVFSNYASESNYLPAVRQACTAEGIGLDVVGRISGQVCDRPEELLGRYDLVFAKARAALEALATGAAVILCDRAGAGPMVTASELDRLRPLNFGIRCLSNPLTPEYLHQEIQRYNPSDAAEVSRRIRATAGREAILDQIVSLYHEVLAEHSVGAGTDREAEARAAAAYLRSVSPVFLRTSQGLLARDLEQLRAERDQLQLSLVDESSLRQQALWERDQLRELFSQLQEGCDGLRQEAEVLRSQRDGLQETLTTTFGSATMRLRASLMSRPWLWRVGRLALGSARRLRRRDQRTRSR